MLTTDGFIDVYIVFQPLHGILFTSAIFYCQIEQYGNWALVNFIKGKEKNFINKLIVGIFKELPYFAIVMLPAKIKTTAHQIYSTHLKRTVALEIYLPMALDPHEKLNLLLLNDGQEAQALKLQPLLATLWQTQKVEAVMVVAISSAENRLQEYGVAGTSDFMERGAKATSYAQFITLELLPYVMANGGSAINGKTGFAGFSLGGLSAFDIVYNHPKLFNLSGVFSGAFWWRTKDLNKGYHEDQHRILHQMVKNSVVKPDVKFWLMTGTAEETADRNGNCIIDVIDDTVDVIKELVSKGFNRYEDLFYYELVGGKHDIDSWAKAFPAFLMWAFPTKNTLNGF